MQELQRWKYQNVKIVAKLDTSTKKLTFTTSILLFTTFKSQIVQTLKRWLPRNSK